MRSKYFESLVAVILISGCIYVGLVGKPQPPNYTGVERDLACILTGGVGLMYLYDIWTERAEMRLIALLLIIAATVVSAALAINSTMFFRI